MTIQQLQGLYIETAEFEKANCSSNPEAILMLETRLNAIYIYQPVFPEDYLPSSHFLAFIYLKKWENNYENGKKLEEGFVRIDDQNPKSLCFYPKNVFEWQLGGGMGYDTSYYKHYRYDLDEETFDEFDLLKRKEYYFKGDETVYKPIKSEVADRIWYFSDSPEEIIKEMQSLRSNLLQNWDSIVEEYIIRQYKRNIPILDIESSVYADSWDLERIKAVIQKAFLQ